MSTFYLFISNPNVLWLLAQDDEGMPVGRRGRLFYRLIHGDPFAWGVLIVVAVIMFAISWWKRRNR